MTDRFVMRLRPSECQLLPQYQHFGFQPPPALEAVAQHADEKEGNCNHVTIMLDSLLAAETQVDGVFGSDNLAVRDRNHHVHMIRHQMPFFDPAFLLCC